jgi:co-chaperonin GroES (HSP10)
LQSVIGKTAEDGKHYTTLRKKLAIKCFMENIPAPKLQLTAKTFLIMRESDIFAIIN